MASGPRDYAAVVFPLPPIQPPAGQLVAGLERPNVLLAVAGGLGIQRANDLGAVAPVARPMGDAGFHPAEAAGRPFRFVAFVPGVADQDQLAADVAGRKLGGAAAAIVKRLSGCAGKPMAGVGADGHDDLQHESRESGAGRRLKPPRSAVRIAGIKLPTAARSCGAHPRRDGQDRRRMHLPIRHRDLLLLGIALLPGRQSSGAELRCQTRSQVQC
jgi:hypothetical protein